MQVLAWLLGTPSSSQLSPAALPTLTSQPGLSHSRRNLHSPTCIGPCSHWALPVTLTDACPSCRPWLSPASALPGKPLPRPQPLPPHLGAPWGKAAGHRPVCQRASPAGRSLGRCRSLGSTSHLASVLPPRRSWCTDRGERAWPKPPPARRGLWPEVGGSHPCHLVAESHPTRDTWKGTGWQPGDANTRPPSPGLLSFPVCTVRVWPSPLSAIPPPPPAGWVLPL